jgi:hypothetical protein
MNECVHDSDAMMSLTVAGVVQGDVYAEGGGLGDGVYKTHSLHFHWGDGSHTQGSEHTVDGKAYPLEV